MPFYVLYFKRISNKWVKSRSFSWPSSKILQDILAISTTLLINYFVRCADRYLLLITAIAQDCFCGCLCHAQEPLLCVTASVSSHPQLLCLPFTQLLFPTTGIKKKTKKNCPLFYAFWIDNTTRQMTKLFCPSFGFV